MEKTQIVGLEGKNNNRMDNGGEKGQEYSEREHTVGRFWQLVYPEVLLSGAFLKTCNRNSFPMINSKVHKTKLYIKYYSIAQYQDLTQ